MSNDSLTSIIDNFNTVRDAISKHISDIIKDETLELDYRWDLFEKASKASLLPEYRYVQHLPTLEELNISWYDDFYKDRYATVDWVSIVESIEDNGPQDYAGRKNRFYEALDMIKCEILAAGYSGFVYDW